MKTLLILLSLSLGGCVSQGNERKVDAACSFLYILPIPLVGAILANSTCIVAADQAAESDEEEDDEEEDDDEDSE